MKKKLQIVNIVVFCGILGGLCVANLLSPDKVFSENENRYLAQMPEFSIQSLFNHTFTNDFETYLNDQFIGRDTWVEGKTFVERALGKTENNGVYFGKEDTLIEKLDPVNEEQMTYNLDRILALQEKVNVPITMTLIPGASNIYTDKLPMFADEVDQLSLIEKAEDYVDDKIQFINVSDDFLAHKDEDIYFRTDHHFNMFGAGVAYEAMAEAMNWQNHDFEYEVVSEDFLGTLASQSGSYSIAPDEIVKLVHDQNVQVTYSDLEEVYSDVYVDANLNIKDKYTYYLNGNHPLVHIQNMDKEGKNVLILRDSYANIFTPYLLSEYENIYLFDLRYNKTEISTFIEENDIDEVLVFYSAKNFMSDTNFAFLR